MKSGAVPTGEEGRRLAEIAEAEQAGPRHTVEGEPVVDLRHVNVAVVEGVGAAPEVRGQPSNTSVVVGQTIVLLRVDVPLTALRHDFHQCAKSHECAKPWHKTRMLKKHTNLCSHAANLGLHLKRACHLMLMPQVLWPIMIWPVDLRMTFSRWGPRAINNGNNGNGSRTNAKS